MPTNGQYAVGELVTASDANTVFSRGNRNAIINGDFFVNQRGFANSGSGLLDAYGLDRWKIVSSGGATWTPQTFTPGNAISGYEPATFSRIVTSGQSGSSVYSILAQPVEDVRTFAGQTTTLSFWAKAASGTPKIAVELAQVFGSGGSPSASSNYYAGQITLSTSWARYTLQIAVPSITGKTIGTTANTSYVALQLWVSAGSSFATRTGSLGIQTNTFDIWGVQWETGQVATPFQIPDRMDQLAQCQRYFRVIPSDGISPYNPYWNVALAGGDQRAHYPFGIAMRTTPTVQTTAGGVIHVFQYRSYNTGAANYNLECPVGGVGPSGLFAFGYYAANNGGVNLPVSNTVATNVNAIWIGAEL